MGTGIAKSSGSYHALPRSFSSAGWMSLGLQQLLLTTVVLFLVPSILFAFVHLSYSATSTLRLLHDTQNESLPPATDLATLYKNVPQLIPTFECVEDTEFVWQIPSNPRPKGVLFLAHGCQCRSTFFWDKHPHCENCTGMPEERTLVLHALSRGFAVIAVSSTGECWNSLVDTEIVIRILKTWIYEEGLEGLPVFGLGASSGGYFISTLALHFKFHSLVIEISSGRFEAIDFNFTYPPTLFVHMPKDKLLSQRVSEARDLLTTKGVRNEEVLCFELKVTPHFFSERIPDLSEEVSERIVAALHHYGYLIQSQKSYYMKRDGRQSSWRMALRKGNVLPYESRLKWERALEEEMNLAYAYHEFTSLPVQYIFDWFTFPASVENSQVLRDAIGHQLQGP